MILVYLSPAVYYRYQVLFLGPSSRASGPVTVLQSKNGDADEFTLSGPHYDTVLRFDGVIGFFGLADRDVKDIVLSVVLYVQLPRLQH